MLSQQASDYLNRISPKGRILRNNDVDYMIYYFEYLLRNNKDYIKILFNIESNDWESIKNYVKFSFSIVNQIPKETGILVTFEVILNSLNDSIKIESETGGPVKTTFDFYLWRDFFIENEIKPQKGGALYVDTSKINNSIEEFATPLIVNFNKLCKSYVLQYDWNGDGVQTTDYIPTKEEYRNGIDKWLQKENGHPPFNLYDEDSFYWWMTIPMDFRELEKLSFIKSIGAFNANTSVMQMIELNTDKELLNHFFGFNIFISFNVQLDTLNLDKILKDTNFCFHIFESTFKLVKSPYNNINDSSFLSDLILDVSTKQRISMESVVSKFTHDNSIDYDWARYDQHFGFSVGQYFLNGLFDKYINRQ